MERGLNAFRLKSIAVIAMVINHFAHVFVLLPVDREVMNVLLTVMNAVGKLTIPIMCFFVAEGYYHTRNLKKYLARMFIFAAVSQIPFYLFEHGIPSGIDDLMNNITHLNVIYSLAMGLLALTIWKSEGFAENSPRCRRRVFDKNGGLADLRGAVDNRVCRIPRRF